LSVEVRQQQNRNSPYCEIGRHICILLSGVIAIITTRTKGANGWQETTEQQYNIRYDDLTEIICEIPHCTSSESLLNRLGIKIPGGYRADLFECAKAFMRLSPRTYCVHERGDASLLWLTHAHCDWSAAILLAWPHRLHISAGWMMNFCSAPPSSRTHIAPLFNQLMSEDAHSGHLEQSSLSDSMPRATCRRTSYLHCAFATSLPAA
jgi:hypothetical protein